MTGTVDTRYVEVKIPAISFEEPPRPASVELLASPDEMPGGAMFNVSTPRDYLGVGLTLDGLRVLRQACDDAIDRLSR
jgi:hypothetical protein